MILMDLNLRLGMTGIDAMNEIRKHGSYSNIPIFAVTGLAMMKDKEKLLAEGFNDYLPKPFSALELRTVVKKYLC